MSQHRALRSVLARPCPSPAASMGLALALLLLGHAPADAVLSAGQQAQQAEDTNILFPVEQIEARLSADEFRVRDADRARPLEDDRSRRVTLRSPDGEPMMEAHCKPVAPPGEGFNNEPRYQLASYRFQKMFLDEPDRVMAPVVLRALSMEEARGLGYDGNPTIRGTRNVLFLVSYWIQDLAVDTVDPFDPQLFDLDEVYARHFANTNVLTHLIDHKDGNHGNVVVSMNSQNRRVFALDNDVAFRSQESDRGDRWGRLQVDRIPAATVERLRALDRSQLQEELGVVAEFRIADGHLEAVEPGPNFDAGRGVRVRDDRVQFGLTEREIRDLARNIERLLENVDRGRTSTF